jgi:hypothetical protein
VMVVLRPCALSFKYGKRTAQFSSRFSGIKSDSFACRGVVRVVQGFTLVSDLCWRPTGSHWVEQYWV